MSDKKLNNTCPLWTDLGMGDSELDRTCPTLTDLDFMTQTWIELVLLGMIVTGSTQSWIELGKT